jgi:hypothetical protein
MSPALVEQGADVGVVELVIDEPAGAAGPDDAEAPQQSQLVGDRGFGQTDDVREIRDAQLAVRQRVYKPDAGWIAQHRERIGQLGRLPLAEKSGAEAGQELASNVNWCGWGGVADLVSCDHMSTRSYVSTTSESAIRLPLPPACHVPDALRHRQTARMVAGKPFIGPALTLFFTT